MQHKLTHDQIDEISKEISVDDLPGDLPEVAELIGIANALKLAMHIGVGRIYLKRWSDNQDQWSDEIRMMVDTIGVDDASIIVDNFKGAHIDIPKCDKFIIQARNKTIIQVAKDRRQVDVARSHNLSDRHVRRILRDASDDRQSDLFEL